MITLDPYSLRHRGIIRYAYAFLPGSTPHVTAPKGTSLGDQFLQTYGAFAQSAPAYLALNQQYQPAYGSLDLQLLNQQLQGSPAQAATQGQTTQIQVPIYGAKGKITGYQTQTVQLPGQPATPAVPGTLDLSKLAASTIRGANIQDVTNLGPQAMQAYLAANPYLKGSLDALQAQTVGSPILAGLNQQAQDALAQGGQLSPQELNMVNQSTLGGFQSLGMANQPQGLGAELLNEDQYSRARLDQNRQFAEGVLGTDASVLGGAAKTFQQTLGDPYQMVLGQGSGAGLFGSGSSPVTSGIGAGTAVNQSQQLFSPTNPYSQDYFNTLYNAQASAGIANANNQAANNAAIYGIYGALLGDIGKAAGAVAFSDKRIKRNIKKVGKTKDGIGIYEWNYRGSNKRFRGPIAQDVEKKKPDAVTTDPKTGFKKVDLVKAKVPFKRWDFVKGERMAA